MLKNQNGGSKADTAVKLALIFFISLFSFSVGTFVGKQVSDNEEKMAALKEDYTKDREIASKEDALSKEDVEELTQEFLAEEKDNSHGDSHKKNKHDDPHAKSAKHEDPHKKSDSHHKKINEGHKKAESHDKKEEHHDSGYKKVAKNRSTASVHDDSHKSAEAHSDSGHKKQEAHTDSHSKSTHSKAFDTHTSKAADRVAHGQAPSTPHHKKKKAQHRKLPKLAASTIGKYTVQVSSYSQEKQAKHRAEALKKKGFSAYYIPAKVKGKTWYRVSIGQFDSYKAANRFRKEIKKTSAFKSSIIQKMVY